MKIYVIECETGTNTQQYYPLTRCIYTDTKDAVKALKRSKRKHPDHNLTISVYEKVGWMEEDGGEWW